MKFSHHWIRDFVTLPDSVDELVLRLTEAGLEVEGIEHKGEALEGIITGRIDSISPHPDADKLVICSVFDGTNSHQIVTGASNINEKDVVPVALPGATVASGMTLKKVALRGVESNGMLCSEEECGVADSSEGIWILPAETPLGLDFIDYAALKDTLLDIAILPNRGDCQSVIGLAREIATLTKQPLKSPEISFRETDLKNPFSVTVKQKDLCPLYTGRYIEGVQNGNSPLWMQQRLKHADMRPVSLIVDISNYVLIETGQPLHTFDAAKCAPDFVVDLATASSTVTTLDEQERTLHDSQLVIQNGGNTVAVAGVMGAQNTEIEESSTKVFLEAAYFEPISTRRSAQSLDLRTDSSIRFEKGVDWSTVDLASRRATQLLQELGGGEVSSTVITEKAEGHELFEKKSLSLDCDLLNQFLGTSFSQEEILSTLSSLGFESNKDSVTVPSWRQRDIQEWPCLAEEVIRLKGFECIPPSMGGQPAVKEEPIPLVTLTDKTKSFFVSNGFSELNTYPMIPAQSASLFGDDILSDKNELANPISPQLAVMRPSLLASHAPIIKHHHSHQIHQCSFFEVGKSFHETGETTTLAFSITGSSYTRPYTAAQKEVSESIFGQAQAMLQRWTTLTGYSITAKSKEAPRWAHPDAFQSLYIGKQCVGHIGLLNADFLDAFGLEQATVYAEISLRDLVGMNPKSTVYKAFSAFPSTRRDIALLAPKDLAYGDIYAVIKQFKHKLVQEVFLFDVFESESLGADKKSLAIGFIYQDQKGTISDDKVNKCHDRLCQQIIKQLPVTIR